MKQIFGEKMFNKFKKEFNLKDDFSEIEEKYFFQQLMEWISQVSK